MSDSYVHLENLILAYGDTVAVDGLDLSIGRSELVTLLGPSGCGKTTTMRAVAGLISPQSGRIFIDGEDVTRTPANKRNVGLVFQSYALFPHLSAYENVAFGLRLRRTPRTEIESRTRAALDTVGLGEFATRNPEELSGGQQQRLALARSLVMEPKLLLLDEPLSNLDARLRLEMRAELQRLQIETGVTMVFVTHDQSEALALADRIVVMRNGKVIQVGEPEVIYNSPCDAFVADFVGFANILECRDGALQGKHGVAGGYAMHSRAGALAWRASDVLVGLGPLNGTVIGSSFGGQHREYVLASDLGVIKAQVPASEAPYPIGHSVSFDLPPDRGLPLPRPAG